MKDFRTVTLADQVFERLESDIIQGVYPRAAMARATTVLKAPGPVRKIAAVRGRACRSQQLQRRWNPLSANWRG